MVEAFSRQSASFLAKRLCLPPQLAECCYPWYMAGRVDNHLGHVYNRIAIYYRNRRATNRMLRIRLSRVGKNKQPSYRIVVAEARTPRDGKFVEQIGYYSPLFDPPKIEMAEEKAKLWLSRGAQPSETVGRLLRVKGILQKDG